MEQSRGRWGPGLRANIPVRGTPSCPPKGILASWVRIRKAVFFLFAVLPGLWDLSSLTRDGPILEAEILSGSPGQSQQEGFNEDPSHS